MRLDPRTKLLILAVTSVSVFMNKSIAVECVLAGIPLALLSTSGNLKRMLKYAAFFLTLLLIQLFIVPRLPVTFGGIVYMFAVYIRKLLPCFMLGSFLIAAITKLRLSKGLTIALAVTLRYFPTMREEWASIRDAMALRGISASAAGLISHPIQTMEHVYVPLLVSASRISDEITQAAITRG
ncbi:MAG: transporter, partial [Clostridiales bacterium 45_37]